LNWNDESLKLALDDIAWDSGRYAEVPAGKLSRKSRKFLDPRHFKRLAITAGSRAEDDESSQQKQASGLAFSLFLVGKRQGLIYYFLLVFQRGLQPCNFHR
jgi:hypothetical protein